jgi:hypothetical protein
LSVKYAVPYLGEILRSNCRQGSNFRVTDPDDISRNGWSAI